MFSKYKTQTKQHANALQAFEDTLREKITTSLVASSVLTPHPKNKHAYKVRHTPPLEAMIEALKTGQNPFRLPGYYTKKTRRTPRFMVFQHAHIYSSPSKSYFNTSGSSPTPTNTTQIPTRPSQTMTNEQSTTSSTFTRRVLSNSTRVSKNLRYPNRLPTNYSPQTCTPPT